MMDGRSIGSAWLVLALCGVGVAGAFVWPAGAGSAAWAGDGGGDGPAGREGVGEGARPDEGEEEGGLPALSSARQVGEAYRAVFALLPDDVESLEQMPSGRGLDSWALFADREELTPVARALVELSRRGSCDFGTGGSLDPSPAHLAGARRAVNLLMHRSVKKLLGDRTTRPSDDGVLGEDGGVDVAAAREYAIAALDVAADVAEHGNFAERAFAADVAPVLMGVVRRSPGRDAWIGSVLRGSRYAASAEVLFGYQAAGIARLRGLAALGERDALGFARLVGFVEASAEELDARTAGMVDRERQVLAMVADALERDWTPEEPMGPAVSLMRSLPGEAALTRALLNEMSRKAAEIAAVREDVRAALAADPVDDRSRGGQEGGGEADGAGDGPGG